MSALRTVLLLLAPVLLAGCGLLERDGEDDDARGASAQQVDERRARYRLDVEAPRPLRAMLAEHLDLARYRDVPTDQGLNEEELDRLILATPDQAKAMLRTEGYFNAEVRVRKEPPSEGERTRVVVTVDPGPRTTVESLKLDVTGELRARADRGEGEAQGLIASLQEVWRLQPGEPFTQGAWTGSKNAALARLQAEGYAAATLPYSEARVRSQQQKVQLEARADSGPRFHLGEIRVEGLQRYPASAVLNLATFRTGMPYTEQRLLDFQDRLRRSNLFAGAVAEISPDASQAAATPVTVRVQEHPLQKLVFGIGLSTDTGARLTAEHTHRQPFGWHWIAQNDVEWGNQLKQWEFDLRSYPRRELWRNFVAGNLERWRGPDEERDAFRLRAGREQDRTRIAREVFGEFNHARVRTPQGQLREAQSLSAHLHWTRRDVDSLLLPRTGKAQVAQVAAGYARSTTADSGPFVRTYARQVWFKPFGTDWYSQARLEVGQVFASQRVGVPDTLLFRAGGEGSVRGYEYRSLGPVVDGVVTSGRSLLTASVEVARPISPRLRSLWGAAFIDAGQAAERFSDLKPVVGVGVGVRYRSPAGPLRADIAYGVEERRFRLHLSAGVNF